MELNEQLIQAITKAVVEQLQGNQPQPHNSEGETLAGKTRMRPMHSYEGAERAPQGTSEWELLFRQRSALPSAAFPLKMF